MELIFEKSRSGRTNSIIPKSDVPLVVMDKEYTRDIPLRLPEIAEVDICRHYTELESRAYGVNDGFYPLGSCTMKYNPKLNERIANIDNYKSIHPLAPLHAVQGCLEVLYKAEKLLSEITGMDRMTFQPAAGAHGELTGMLLIKAYHKSRGDNRRTKVIIPDSAHGTNPATCAMIGYEVINIASNADGSINIEELKANIGEDTAGLMLTNPNTVGVFDENIMEITRLVHDVGGLNYYDGANLNGIMGIVRPGDMGFDVIHLNLHKTFSTPHGGGGPGSGAVGCKSILVDFLPNNMVYWDGETYHYKDPNKTIGSVKQFYGNYLVVLRALAYIMILGAEGIKEVSNNAVLNANYLKELLVNDYEVMYGDSICMHEFVLTIENLKKKSGVSALDIAKTMIDRGIHPPTMYFPLIVHEALMFEPTETESIDTLDEVARIMLDIARVAKDSPEELKNSPIGACIGRPDETMAARNPILKYEWNKI